MFKQNNAPTKARVRSRIFQAPPSTPAVSFDLLRTFSSKTSRCVQDLVLEFEKGIRRNLLSHAQQ